jgi:hypothetical protein
MADSTGSDTRSLRSRREAAVDRVTYGRWIAIGSGTVAMMFLARRYQVDASSGLAIPVVIGYALQLVAGILLRTDRPWAGWTLAVAAVAALSTSILQFGLASGILPRTVAAVGCLWGAMGAIRHGGFAAAPGADRNGRAEPHGP